MPEEQWESIKSIPGMTGDEDFDEAMREFRAKYHREEEDDEPDMPVFEDDD